MKKQSLFLSVFVFLTFFVFPKISYVAAEGSIDLTAKTTVSDPYCKGVIYSFDLPKGGVNFRGMSGYASMTPSEPVFTESLVWAANMPDGNCPPNGSLLNREDGSSVYPETDSSTWIASYILKNADNQSVRVDTNFQLPVAIPMKGCVFVVVGGCGVKATTLTSESHMALLYDTVSSNSSQNVSLASIAYELGYGGPGGASGAAPCLGSNCSFATVWRADRDYSLYYLYGDVSGGGVNGSSSYDPPSTNWSADFDYYLYKNCDSMKAGTSGPADFYGQIPSDAVALDNIHQDVNNSWSKKAAPDKSYYFGVSTDQPVTGDWNGDGKTEIGNYKGNGVWAVDYNGNGAWDGVTVDKLFTFGSATDQPVTGDWNGDGKTEVGNYKGNGVWALDYNGNGAWDGTAIDKVFTFTVPSASSGDVPVAGDWNGDKITEIGVYQPVTETWYVDYNGNGAWDGPMIDKVYQFGGVGDLPVTGDWNGDGKTEVGNYKGNGIWAVDYNGNGAWDGTTIDKTFSSGNAVYQPVVGDWNNDKKDEIGSYKNGAWILDYDGKGALDPIIVEGTASFNDPVIKQFSPIAIRQGNCIVGLNRGASSSGGAINLESQVFAEIMPDIKGTVLTFGGAGDKPVVGDWNGDGKTEIGNYKGNGIWAVDYNSNGQWDGVTIDKVFNFIVSGANSSDIPVVGDWNGNKISEIGIYRPATGTWYLDYNGNGVWDGLTIDKLFTFGSATDQPVPGDWNGDGKTEIGNYKGNGTWAVDYNGNGAWDGTPTDKIFNFGAATDQPVTGDWNGDGKTEVGNYKGNGAWVVDYNGNGAWDGSVIDKIFNFGLAGDLPVTGDWNGDKKTEIGAYRLTNFNFYLNYDKTTIINTTCTAGSINGCQICEYNGSGWISRCSSGQTCSNNQCVATSACISNCSGKACGTDGCGGFCGTCSINKICNNGTCQTNGGGGGTINPPVTPHQMTRVEILAKVEEIKKLLIQLIQQLIVELQKQLPIGNGG